MAKLLFITQKVDSQDDVLGFVHLWISRMASRWDSITVVCLEKGGYDLPDNVKVLSLGKESGPSRFGYLARFFKYITSESYDSVFVHMNPLYAVLGGPFWRLTGKKVVLWYLHPQITLSLRLALLWANKVATANAGSFPLKSPKVIAVGHGIPVDIFHNMDISRKPRSILVLSRISPVKNIDLIIESLKILKDENSDFSCTIIGDASPGQAHYLAGLKNKVQQYGLENVVEFKSGVPNHQAPDLYNQFEIFVNLTSQGSLDKTILEAMACEMLVVTTNKIFSGIAGILVAGDNLPETIAAKLAEALSQSKDEQIILGKQAREYVIQNHNLDTVILRITELL